MGPWNEAMVPLSPEFSVLEPWSTKPIWSPELSRNQINVKKILAVINATYAIAKRKPEKIRLAGITVHLFLHSAVQIYEFHIFIFLSRNQLLIINIVQLE